MGLFFPHLSLTFDLPLPKPLDWTSPVFAKQPQSIALIRVTKAKWFSTGLPIDEVISTLAIVMVSHSLHHQFNRVVVLRVDPPPPPEPPDRRCCIMADAVISVPEITMEVLDYSEMFTSMLNGFVEIGDHVMGHQWNCGVACLNSVQQVLAEMLEQHIPSWTCLIQGLSAGGYGWNKKQIHVDLSCLSISLIQLMQMNKNVSCPNTITSMVHKNSKGNHLSKSLKFFNKTLERVHIMFNFVSGAEAYCLTLTPTNAMIQILLCL